MKKNKKFTIAEFHKIKKIELTLILKNNLLGFDKRFEMIKEFEYKRKRKMI